MTEPQEPTREIDMAKLLEDQAEQATTTKTDGVAGDPKQATGEIASAEDAAQ